MNDSTRSGKKFLTEMGFSAIKDGIKTKLNPTDTELRKPSWLRAKFPSGPRYQVLRDVVRKHNLSTVCEESHCPNIGECWNNGTATIMLMGSVCTRACKFCSVDTGNPAGWLDPEEPVNAAKTVEIMNLRYIVLTSVDRDDLPDGGASHYSNCVREIKKLNPNTAVEALAPDFLGSEKSISILVTSGLDVFAQNLETVERLTHEVRDVRAGYYQTLNVLAYAKKIQPTLLTKSSLMLGLGENDTEIKSAMKDLRKHNVDILTLGQYLRPTANHLSVKRWVTPDEFRHYREWGLALGFTEVAAGPLVRSSYRADRILDKNNLGLNNIPIKTI